MATEKMTTETGIFDNNPKTEKTEITLRELKDMGACCRKALWKFEEVFGEKASIKDVVEELHTREHPKYEKWESWLLIQTPSLTFAMIENGADVNTNDGNALCMAMYRSVPVEIVELLLENEADVHIRNNSPLRCASLNGYTEKVKLLLENGADVHACDNHAFYNKEILNLLEQYS